MSPWACTATEGTVICTVSGNLVVEGFREELVLLSGPTSIRCASSGLYPSSKTTEPRPTFMPRAAAHHSYLGHLSSKPRTSVGEKSHEDQTVPASNVPRCQNRMIIDHEVSFVMPCKLKEFLGVF